ncbi:MAG: MBL fold metallo-hydrolase [Patescibacteria group bacterium]
MKLTFHGGAKSVTGANYLLESGGTEILIDCGLEQGGGFCENENWSPFLYDVTRVAAIFPTHAHIDHTGRLPKIVKEGFRGTVYSTAPTREAAQLLLEDSDHILADEAERCKQKVIFEAKDIHTLMALWKTMEYHQSVHVGPFTVTAMNSAHVLGSSFLLVEAEGKKIIFSGDMGNAPMPLLGSPELMPKADYCVIESAYGDRIHEDLPRRKEILEDVIEETIKRGGTLMIPAFAMERTQEILFEIDDLVTRGRIPHIPVFLDSPLAIKLTAVYKKYDNYFDHPKGKQHRGEHDFSFSSLRQTITTAESRSINEVRGAKVIVAGSGMMHGGRILHHAKRYLPDPNSTLLIVGYQARNSLGRQILDGVPTITIHGETVPVRAHIKAIGGYSAHADQNQLLHWIYPVRGSLKKVFIVQGEEEAAEALRVRIVDKFAVHASVPSRGDEVVL